MLRLPGGRGLAPGFAGVALTGLAVTSSTSVLALAGLLALVVLAVIVPAVWSKSEQRRKDALAVLDRIFGRGDRAD